MSFDDFFWLVGDEDCGVGINCRVCDRGGAPVAYYAGISQPYPTAAAPDVVPTDTVAGLFATAVSHAREVHGVNCSVFWRFEAPSLLPVPPRPGS